MQPSASGDKVLRPYGLAAHEMQSPDMAKYWAYTRNDDSFPPTPIVFPENPFNDVVKAARECLEIGCGNGRNFPAVIEQTEARYSGIDPNGSMLRMFRDSHPDLDPRVFEERCYLAQDFDDGVRSRRYDLVLTTFVFQHLGFRAPAGMMNIADITRDVLQLMTPGAVWILFEHEEEEAWIDRWRRECGIDLAVYERFFEGFPALNDRGMVHHLMIYRHPAEEGQGAR